MERLEKEGKCHKMRGVLFVVGFLFFVVFGVQAGEFPPQGSKPLSQILVSAKKVAPGVVTQAEFDDGVWKVEVCEAKACKELYLDPVSARVRHQANATAEEDVPPPKGLSLATIVKGVERSGLGMVTDAEFDDGVWKIKLNKGGQEREIEVDAETGRPIRR